MELTNNSKYEGSVLLPYLSSDWQKELKINEEYLVRFVPAKSLLLKSGRYDLLSKYLYIDAYSKGLECQWFEDLYLQYIFYFNNFIEDNADTKKVGKKSFIENFKQLYISIKEKGYDPLKGLIPVNRSLTPIDGGHRIAICALLNLDVQILFLDTETNFNYSYFQKKGMDQLYLDHVAHKYCKVNANAFIALRYPTAGSDKDEEVIKLIEEIGDIFYTKNLYLQNNGPYLATQQLYRMHPWSNNDEQDKNICNKANSCYRSLTPLRIIVFKSNSLDKVIETKGKIRTLFGIANDSIHITDNPVETLECANLFLNKNTIHWLNHASKRQPPRFKLLFNLLQQNKKSYGIESDNICFEGSSTLAAYGIRDVSDIDIMHDSYHGDLKLDETIELSNFNLKYLKNYTPEDILYNPENFFYFKNEKFLFLEPLLKLKKKRNLPKDKKDIVEINKLVKKSLIFKYKSKFSFLWTYYLGHSKLILKKLLPTEFIDVYRKIRDFN